MQDDVITGRLLKKIGGLVRPVVPDPERRAYELFSTKLSSDLFGYLLYLGMEVPMADCRVVKQ